MPAADQHACSVCTHSERLFLPLHRGQVEATSEVSKYQTQLAAPVPFGDLDLQSMQPPKNYIASETSTQPRIINTTPKQLKKISYRPRTLIKFLNVTTLLEQGAQTHQNLE